MILNYTLSTLLMAVSVVILITSVCIDRRRFRNGFYLLIFMILLVVWLASAFPDSGAVHQIVLLAVLFVVFLTLIVPFLLIINGFFMLKREGFRLANLLSLLFGVFIILGEIALFAAPSSTYTGSNHLLSACYFSFSFIVIYVSMLFLSFMFYSLLIQIMPRRTDFDYIIIHGAGLIGGEQVSHLLSERLDKGIAVYRRSMSAAKIIVSGGRGADEKISEAEAMRQYLLQHGIPDGDILLEDRSDSTMKNLINCRQIIRQRGGRQLTCLVTSNFHVLRALIYSRDIGLPCTGIGSKVAFYYWPSAMIREFIALMKEYLFWFVLGMIAIILMVFIIIYY